MVKTRKKKQFSWQQMVVKHGIN